MGGPTASTPEARKRMYCWTLGRKGGARMGVPPLVGQPCRAVVPWSTSVCPRLSSAREGSPCTFHSWLVCNRAARCCFPPFPPPRPTLQSICNWACSVHPRSQGKKAEGKDPQHAHTAGGCTPSVRHFLASKLPRRPSACSAPLACDPRPSRGHHRALKGRLQPSAARRHPGPCGQPSWGGRRSTERATD